MKARGQGFGKRRAATTQACQKLPHLPIRAARAQPTNFPTVAMTSTMKRSRTAVPPFRLESYETVV